MSLRITSLGIANLATFEGVDPSSISFYGVHDDADRRIDLNEMRALVGMNLGVLAVSNADQTIGGTYLRYENTTHDPDSWRIGVSSVVCQIPNDNINYIRIICNQENTSTTVWQRSYPRINGSNAVPLAIINNDHAITRAWNWQTAPIPVNSGDLVQIYGDGGVSYTKRGVNNTWVAVIPWGYTR